MLFNTNSATLTSRRTGCCQLPLPGALIFPPQVTLIDPLIDNIPHKRSLLGITGSDKHISIQTMTTADLFEIFPSASSGSIRPTLRSPRDRKACIRAWRIDSQLIRILAIRATFDCRKRYFFSDFFVLHPLPLQWREGLRNEGIDT